MQKTHHDRVAISARLDIDANTRKRLFGILALIVTPCRDGAVFRTVRSQSEFSTVGPKAGGTRAPIK